MTRRTLILAIPQALSQGISDPWRDLAEVWNPFAEQINKGILDLKQWKKVLRAVDRIEGRTCKA